jgi:hypothetical protein
LAHGVLAANEQRRSCAVVGHGTARPDERGVIVSAAATVDVGGLLNTSEHHTAALVNELNGESNFTEQAKGACNLARCDQCRWFYQRIGASASERALLDAH